MEFSIKLHTIKLGGSIVYRGATGYNFQKKYIVFLSLKIDYDLANSADPDGIIPYYTAFHLGLHCLPKYPLGVSGPQRASKDLILSVGYTHF